jgi:hypothetical protein
MPQRVRSFVTIGRSILCSAATNGIQYDHERPFHLSSLFEKGALHQSNSRPTLRLAIHRTRNIAITPARPRTDLIITTFIVDTIPPMTPKESMNHNSPSATHPLKAPQRGKKASLLPDFFVHASSQIQTKNISP